MDCDKPLRNGYRGVTALVLGASGFIGRWVASELCCQQANVHLVVRNKNIAKEIFAMYDIKGVVVEADLRSTGTLPELFRRIKPSITFNLIGYGVDPTERDEETAYQTNTEMITMIGSAIAQTKDDCWSGQDIIHTGSALEYGTINGDLTEDSIPKPTTAYGKSKLAGTQRLALICRQRQIKGITARLFTVFGPGEHEGRLLPSLLEVVDSTNPVLLSAGMQERDFTYVTDVAKGLLRLGLVNKATPGEVVNLATGRLTSVRSFAEAAAGILGISQDRLKFGAMPTRAEEMQHSAVTIERLRNMTSWQPGTPVESGIQQAVQFIRRLAAVG